MQDKVIIWGASGHALVVADIVRSQGLLHIEGFVDDRAERQGAVFADSVVLGDRNELAKRIKQGIRNVIIAVGDCDARVSLARIATDLGANLSTAVHPTATISSYCTVGPGSIIAAHAVLGAGCRIGSNVIVNTAATVDHECVVEDGVHIGPGVHIGGGSTLKQRCWIGIGATISDHIEIGPRSIVGAGAVVVRNVPPNVVAFGVPARTIRTVDEGS